MANIKSQQKRNRTNERARLRNKAVKSSLRTAVRAFREAAHAGDKAKAAELLASTNRKLDKAASKGVIHKTRPPTRSRHWPRRSTSSDSHLPTHRPRSATNSATCRTADSSA